MNGTATHPDPELDLLGDDPSTEYTAGAHHSSRTAPVFSGDALDMLGTSVFPQRALYGRLISQHAPQLAERPSVPKVYINTNTPFSAVVCGVQGSGKSHSASVLLESCLIKDTRIGILPEPLSALLFHFDTAAGGGFVQPCEAAYLSQLNPNLRGEGIVPPPVTVLVVPSYLQSMKKVYAGLPNVRVEPLLFGPGDISGERLLSMMKVDESSQMPLYMESIMAILRSMQDEFDYYAFRTAIEQQGFNRSQMSMLRIRLSLLDSCLEGGTIENSVASHFGKGQLTIIDLSSPFMDGSTACGFFDMILGLFIEADIGVSGKLVVLDEAHKYLSESQTGSSGRLTESLLSVIRQQRHLATRIVISTQEPTVIPSKFLALCSIIIAHRFSSPMWLKELGQHVSAAQGSTEELFSQIIALPTGHAIMFAPNALCVRDTDNWGEEDGSKSRSHGLVSNLGQGYLQVRSRLRLTRDGGHSLLAVADPEHTTRLDRVSARSGAAAGAASSSGVNGWNLPAHKPLTPQPRVSATQDTASSRTTAHPAPVASTSLPPSHTQPTVRPSVESDSESDAESDESTAARGPPNGKQKAEYTSTRSPSIDSEPLSLDDPQESDSARAPHYGQFAQLVQVMASEHAQFKTIYMQRTILRDKLLQRYPAVYGTTKQSVNTKIAQAIHEGVLLEKTKKGSLRVYMNENYGLGLYQADSRTVLDDGSTLYVTGTRVRFAPLIRYMLGPPALRPKIAKIQGYFNSLPRNPYGRKLKEITALVGEAVQQGLLQYTNEARSSVQLVPGRSYQFS